MAQISADRVAQHLVELGLVNQDDLKLVWSHLGRRDASVDELYQAMMRLGLLTNWQVDKLVKGDRKGYFYGDYKVQYLAGVGTFARVYRCVHKNNDGNMYAVKVLRSRFSDDALHVNHFLREGEIGKQLNHPNIVRTYEASSHRGVHYIVMEFIEGDTLKELIRIRKRFDPAEATRLMIEITAALMHAFKQGIMHRDMKLTNVLVTSHGQAKVVDFGLAASQQDEIARTVDYAGLERATGAPKDDPRSDIYFLGAIYYHMLSGVPPLMETKNRVERASKTRYLNVPPIHHVVSGLPRSVVGIVERAMDLNPSRRYQSLTELFIELKQIANRVGDEAAGDALTAETVAAARGKQAVMVVESNTEMQNALRQGLKKCGYRVLMTSDPRRALARFHDDKNVAQCVVFSAGNIGSEVVDVFNQFGDDDLTKDVPAILLLDAHQAEWKERAQLSDHRGLIMLPLKMKSLREEVSRLLEHRAHV
jgi:serine/threonine-protein kinase